MVPLQLKIISTIEDNIPLKQLEKIYRNSD